jgi:hypothetical protein
MIVNVDLEPEVKHEYKEFVVNVMDRPHSCAFWYVCDVLNFNDGELEVTMSGEQFLKFQSLFQAGHTLKITGDLYEDGSFALQTAEFQRIP